MDVILFLYTPSAMPDTTLLQKQSGKRGVYFVPLVP